MNDRAERIELDRLTEERLGDPSYDRGIARAVIERANRGTRLAYLGTAAVFLISLFLGTMFFSTFSGAGSETVGVDATFVSEGVYMAGGLIQDDETDRLLQEAAFR